MGQYNIDESVVKKPQHDLPLTEYEQEEWLKCANDKYYWMRTYVYVQSGKGKLLFDPRDYQQRIIDTCEENRFVIGVSGRQSGKTSSLGIDVLHDCIFNEDYKVGISSYKLKNVKDYIERIKYAYENLPFWMKPPVIEYNRFNIRFSNASSIISEVTNESTFRGLTLQRIILDEFAFVKPDVANELWTSLLPSISADGENATTRLNIISTPNGTSGIFPMVWFGAKSKSNGFAAVEVKYEEVPGRTEKFEKDMIKKMGREKFEQEFKNKFISNKGTLINSMVLESITPKDPVEEFGDLRIYVSDLSGRCLAMACDVGEGIGQDDHTIQIVDIDTMEQVAEYNNNMISQTIYTKEIIKIMKFLYSRRISELYFTIENNGLGSGVLRLIENANEPVLDKAVFISDVNEDGSPSKRLGMYTTNRSKLAGCTQLKDVIELGKLTIYSELLLTQLKFFIRKGASYEAERGMKR